ncbi:MAG: helix-hairpin-helix domain-containing protein [Janthinobacterium lividum]
MVTRSIVGRFMILAVLLVSLGVIAQAAIIITRGSGKAVAKHDGSPVVAMAALAGTPAIAPPAATDPAAPAAATSTQPADAAPVRVVYPGPLGDTPIQPRKITASLPLDAPAQAPAPTPVAPVASAVPIAQQPTTSLAPVAAIPDPTPIDAAKPADPTVASAEPEASATPATASAHGVNLNNASVAQLNSMGAGHIGQAIVQHRPYHSVDDLMKKRVIRRSIFDQIKNQVAAE